MRSKLVLLVLVGTLLLPRPAASAAPDDPHLWLEAVNGKQALAWAKRQSREATRELTSSRQFQALDARFLDILNADARIPSVQKLGDRYYNFWNDAKHERGIWRRTTLEEYRKVEPAWETVIDLDSLAKAEKEDWVWVGADPLPPDYERCLVSLSRGGADAAVVREFSLATRSFVEGGFSIPESKSSMTWINRDLTFVACAFDSSTMTESGYPRVVKEWKRGTPLSSATTVVEIKPEDIDVEAFHDHTPGFERDFVRRGITTYTNELFLRRGATLVRIGKPDDAEANVHREWLLIQLRTDWTVGGRTYPAGALLATNLERFLAGAREFDILFEPTERTSLADYSTTRNTILLNELDNVRGRIHALRYEEGRWSRTPLPGLPELGTMKSWGVDDLESDDYWLSITDLLTPSSLCLGTIGQGPAAKLKEAPAFFDADRETVSQHEAISRDGTRIPYFEVDPRDLEYDGSAPTLMTGYGGFEIPMKPYYSGTYGCGWMEQGGVFVLANIRGGGEFGPKWHQAALKANRPRAYEDFIAVAEDLIRRKVTSPRHLGCIGGSNGGLLVGNMLTMRPDLFGAIVCEAPLLDMKRYHKMLAGASWMGEYGNPDDPGEWSYIRTFSPYQNVRKGVKYPRTFFTSSTRDDRVHPGHARKMVARMKKQGHDVLYYENIEGGHAGAANNRQRAFLSALAFTFLWKQLGPAPGQVGGAAAGRGHR